MSQHKTLRRLPVALILLALLALAFGPAPTGLAGNTAIAQAAELSPALLRELAASANGEARFFVLFEEQADLAAASQIGDWSERGRYVYDTLRAVAERSQRDVQAALEAEAVPGKISHFQSFWIVNAILVQGDQAAAKALSARPGVAQVIPSFKLEAPVPVGEATPADSSPDVVEWNIQRTNADDVWLSYGVRGEDTVLANIDDGVDETHPALINQYRGTHTGSSDYNWFDPFFVYPNPFPVDGTHGTQTMGVIAGSDGGANEIGMAPEAEWIAAFGCCPNEEALLLSTEWMLAPCPVGAMPGDPACDPDQRPHVVNNSWGGPGGGLIFNPLLEAQRAAGIFPVFSAGNSGPECGTLGSPGDNPMSFNVGATGQTNNIAGFSARGPDPFDGGISPAISAPGESIRTSTAPNTYSTVQGTSFSAPHVAGAVGLLWSAEPMLIGQIEQTEELLQRSANTALPFSGQTCGGLFGLPPNNVYGWGLLDIKAAVDLVWQAGVLSGQVTDANTSQPIADALVSITRLGKTLTQRTDSAGQYSFVAGAGNWDMAVEGYGYVAGAAGAVSVTQDAMVQQDFALAPKPVYTLSGVVDSGGSPIWGAKVEVLGAPAMGYTDSSGHYSIPVAEGDYEVQASAPGADPATQDVTVSSRATADFTLAPRWDYYYRDSRSGPGCAVPYNWVDIASSGNRLWTAMSDGGSAQASFGGGSNFAYWGSNYTSLFVRDDGYVTLGVSPIGVYGNFGLPYEGKPNGAVFVMTDDLQPKVDLSQGSIYGQRVGNEYVVSWEEVHHWEYGNPETFQVVLDLNNDQLTMQYDALSWPDFTISGVEDQAGQFGVTYANAGQPNALADGLAVRFYPFNSPANWPAPADVNCDGAVNVLDITLVGDIWNTATGDAGFVHGYDMDKDGDVDIGDIQFVAWWWGWTS